MKLLRASVILLAALLALTLWNAYSIESLRRGVELYEAAYPRDRVSVHPILLEDLKSSYVIFADGMEGSLKWTKYGSGEIGVTGHTSFGGGSSLMLRTGNGSWVIVEALRLFAPPRRKVVGFGFWWLCYHDNFGYLDFGIEYRNALNDYRKAGEIYVYGTGGVYYKNEAGDLVRFEPAAGLPEAYDLSERGGDWSWHFAAIVVDFEKSEYVKLVLDDKVVDMEGIKIYDRLPKEGPAEYNMMEVFVIASSGGGSGSTECLIDDVIVFTPSRIM